MKGFLYYTIVLTLLVCVVCVLRIPNALFPENISTAYLENADYDHTKVPLTDYSIWRFYRNNDLAKAFNLLLDPKEFFDLHPNNEITKAYRLLTNATDFCRDHPNNEACKGKAIIENLSGFCDEHPNNETCKGKAMIENLSGFCDEHPNNETCKGKKIAEDIFISPLNKLFK